MKNLSFILLLLLSFLQFNCKESSNVKTDEITIDKQVEEKDAIDLIEEQQAADLDKAFFYVIAPNGLSFRKEDDLNSEKLLTIPFGGKLKQTEAIYTADLTVENILGSMLPVRYNGQEGYVFD